MEDLKKREELGEDRWVKWAEDAEHDEHLRRKYWLPPNFQSITIKNEKMIKFTIKERLGINVWKDFWFFTTVHPCLLQLQYTVKYTSALISISAFIVNAMELWSNCDDLSWSFFYFVIFRCLTSNVEILRIGRETSRQRRHPTWIDSYI